MAEDKSVRVVVKVHPARHPELFEALNDIESPGRAERLRTLALMALSGYAGSGEGPTEGGPGGAKRSNRKASKAGASAKSEKPDQSKAPERQASDEAHNEASAQNDEGGDNKEEEDPHKDVRASVLSGLKNVGF